MLNYVFPYINGTEPEFPGGENTGTGGGNGGTGPGAGSKKDKFETFFNFLVLR